MNETKILASLRNFVEKLDKKQRQLEESLTAIADRVLFFDLIDYRSSRIRKTADPDEETKR